MDSSTSDNNTSDPDNTFEVQEVLVRQSVMSSDEPYDLIAEVIGFVNFCNAQGAILLEELPRNALRSYYTDYYHLQVNNGGHGQFAGNSNWSEATNDCIREGLEAFGSEDIRGIFDEFSNIMESDPDRAQFILDGCGFGEILPEVKELDSRFFALETHKTLVPAHNAWLRTLPELRTVEDEDYEKELQALIVTNPHVLERNRERQSFAIKTNTQNLELTAAKMLCRKAGLSTQLKVRFGRPGRTAPDGRKGMAWSFLASGDPYDLFVFEDVAILCDMHQDECRSDTSELNGSSAAGLTDIDDAWVSEEYREIARVPIATVQRAIAQAKLEPLLSIAEVLLLKSGVADRVADLSAVLDPQTDDIEWEIRLTARPPFHMTLTEETARLDGPGGKNLLTLDRQSITKIIPLAEAFQAQQGAPVALPPPLKASSLAGYLSLWVRLSAETGMFAAAIVAYLIFVGEFTVLGITMIVAVSVFQAYRISKAKGVVERLQANSDYYPEEAWALDQLKPILLVKFAAIGAASVLVVLGIGLGLNWSLFGSPGLTTIALLIAGFVAFNVATKHWVNRQMERRTISGRGETH